MWEHPLHTSSEVSSVPALKVACMTRPPYPYMIHTRLAVWGSVFLGVCPCIHWQSSLSYLDDGGWVPLACCGAITCSNHVQGEKGAVLPMTGDPACAPSQWIPIPQSHIQADTKGRCHELWLSGRGSQLRHEGGVRSNSHACTHMDCCPKLTTLGTHNTLTAALLPMTLPRNLQY